MAIAVLLVCIAWPLLEIAVLVKVGQAVGFWPTLGTLIGAAVLGLAVLYWQGWNTVRQAQKTLLQGEAPFGAMIDGVLLVIAGCLLLAPGLIGDVIALVLLVPPVRRLIARRVLRHLNFVEVREGDARSGGRPSGRDRGPVIEGEFERLDEQPVDGSDRPRDRRH